MLVESFKPESFPFFPQSISRHIFTRVCARSTQKYARYFFELWLVTNSWRQRNFFAACFRRWIFSVGETKAEETGCPLRLVVCRIRNTCRRVLIDCTVIIGATISCRSFVFGQSRAKVSAGFTNVSGLAVAAFDLVYCSLSLLRFVLVLDISY